MKPLVTVIVPVYNVQNYLVHCVESLGIQSLREIEIILIDDASTDRSGDICERWAAKDARFKVIHHMKNKGLSEARNTGLKAASAPYLMFLDGDDKVHSDFCRATYECAIQNKADLVLFRHKTVKTAFWGSTAVPSANSMPNGYRTKIETLDLMQGSIGQMAWNKFYRKELFTDVFYPPGYLYEDWGTTYKLVLRAKRIFFLDRVLYHHYEHAGNITSLRSEKVIKDRFAMMMQQYRDLAVWGGYKEKQMDALLCNIAMSYCIKKKRDPTDPDYVFCVETLRAKTSVPSSFTLRGKLLFLLFKYYGPLFEWICFLWGKKCS